MPFSGSGAGTIGDPYQITTLAEFRKMNSANILSPVHTTGSGLNDTSSEVYNIADGYSHTLVGSHSFIAKITGGGGLTGKSAYYDGSGYEVGDVYYVDGGTEGDLAEITLWSNGGSGVLFGFDITKAGSGYSLGAHTVSPKTGSGINGHISITGTSADTFQVKKDAGSFGSNITIDGSFQDIGNSVGFKFAAIKGHTVNDEWTIDVTPVQYFKLMNDLDWSGQNTSLTAHQIPNFQGFLDGNDKVMLNMTVGVAYVGGVTLMSGCSVKDITYRITTSINNNESDKERLIFAKKGGGALSNVSLTGIKIITSNTGQLLFFSDANFTSTCTLTDIVLEGDIQQGFNSQSMINCTLESMKVLKTYSTPATQWTPIVLVASLGTTGIMKYCQVIATGIVGVENGYSFLVGSMQSGAIIQESFDYGFLTVDDPTLDASMSHGFVALYAGTTADASEVKDCYFKGKLTTNGGEQTSGASPDMGKAGYAITAAPGLKINRCVVNADFDTPLNDNRNIFSRDNGTNRVNNNFYKSSAVQSITPVDIASRQTGLTDEEWADSASFDTFDFDAIWIMGDDGPELRNNPLYAFETSLISVSVTSHTRINGTSFNVVLSAQFTSDFGIDVFDGESLVYTSANTLSNEFTVPLLDVSYTLKSFYMDGITKVYTTPITHMHYAMDSAVAALLPLPVTEFTFLGTVAAGANHVHGSLIYDGYIYGVARNQSSYNDAAGLQGNRSHAKLARIPEHDTTNYELITIKACDNVDGDYAIGQFTSMIEQLVQCRGFLYFVFYSILPTPTQYLCQYNPVLNTYKVFRMPTLMQPGTAPLIADEEYLYFTDYINHQTSKVLASQFEGSFPQYNTDVPFDITISAVYDTDSQGGHITGGYAANFKGEVHAACTDNEYLYLAFVTAHAAGIDISGYHSGLDISVHELHKVRKSDMTAAGFVMIPKATDDMTQNATHLFLGIEVQAGADPLTFGYGWGAYAVRKSDMKRTEIPRLHSREFPPVVQSYGSVLFGNYLFDIRTDLSMYLLDISDVDNWNLEELIGQRTIAGYHITGLGGNANTLPNEILKASDDTFYEFTWALPSGIVEFVGPAYDYNTTPIVQTSDAILL